MTDYLLQRDGSCCFVFAVANALRFLGKPSPEPGTDEWERLVNIAGCRHGSTISEEGVAEAMGFRLEEIPVEEATFNIPCILAVLNPRPGMTLHAVLVIGIETDGFRMVNYRTDTGPVVEVAHPKMCRSGNPNRQCWALRRL